MKQPYDISRNIGLRFGHEDFSFDFEAASLMQRMSGAGATPISTRKIAINNWFTNIKADHGVDSITELFDFVYFFAAHDRLVYLLDWTPNKFNGTEVDSGDLTYVVDRGINSGGSGYIKSNFTPNSDGVAYVRNSASFGLYNRTAGNDAGIDMGSVSGGLNGSAIRIRFTDDNRFYRINNGGSLNPVAGINPLGLAAIDRLGSTSIEAFANGVLIDTDTDTSESLPNREIYILALNDNNSAANFTNRQISMVFMGGANVNQLQLYTRTQQYLTELGAQV